MSVREIDLKYIPLDKSWIIRMGLLDIVNGRDDIQKFLSTQENLGDDLIALKNVAHTWKSDLEVDVGESGTLYRLLKFASWKLGLNKKFITHGTLPQRKITDNPEITKLSQKELLHLDNGTSQWATAAVILGDTDRLSDAPYKLQLTYEAVEHWKSQKEKGKTWEARYDKTILNQAKAFLDLLNNKKINFNPEQAEDFCFAYTFGLVTVEEGEKRWPSLRGHESDRILEMKDVLELAEQGKEIASKDHRVVQAIAMWGMAHNKPVNILFPNAVNKSWPPILGFFERIRIVFNGDNL